MITSKFWYAALSCYLLILGFLSLNPWILPVSTNSIFSPDKLDHAFAYGGLTIIVFFCLTISRNAYGKNSARAWMVAILISSLFGVLVEVAQSLFTRNRVGSVDDALANIIGAVIGYIFYHVAKYIHAKVTTKA